MCFSSPYQQNRKRTREQQEQQLTSLRLLANQIAPLNPGTMASQVQTSGGRSISTNPSSGLVTTPSAKTTGSSNVSTSPTGHEANKRRFLGPIPVEIDGAASYGLLLEQNKILLRILERNEAILRDMSTLSVSLNHEAKYKAHFSEILNRYEALYQRLIQSEIKWANAEIDVKYVLAQLSPELKERVIAHLPSKRF